MQINITGKINPNTKRKIQEWMDYNIKKYLNETLVDNQLADVKLIINITEKKIDKVK